MNGAEAVADALRRYTDRQYTVPGFPITTLGSLTGAELVINEKTALEYALGDSLMGRRVAVIGAGGAARSVVYACAKKGGAEEIVILNRTLSRAEELARKIAEATGLPAAITDVNDIGGSWVLGSHGIDDPRLIEDILRDNPLGQKAEQTPLGLIRREP